MAAMAGHCHFLVVAPSLSLLSVMVMDPIQKKKKNHPTTSRNLLQTQTNLHQTPSTPNYPPTTSNNPFPHQTTIQLPPTIFNYLQQPSITILAKQKVSAGEEQEEEQEEQVGWAGVIILMDGALSPAEYDDAKE